MPDHELPSDSLLTQFTGFFQSARVLANGSVQVNISLTGAAREAVMDLARDDGMALNFDVFTTTLPDELDNLARLLGMDE